MINRREFLIRSLAFSAGWLGATSVPYIKTFFIDKPALDQPVAVVEKILFNQEQLQQMVLGYKGVNSLDNLPQEELVKIETELLELINQASLFRFNSLEDRIHFLFEEDFKNKRTRLIEEWLLADTEVKLLSYKKALHAKNGLAYVAESVEDSIETAKYSDFLTVKKWNPQMTCVGEAFNEQHDGHSSNWFQIEGYSGPLVIYFGGLKIKTTFKGPTATTRIEGEVFDELTKQVGDHDIVMYNPQQNIKQKVGVFSVKSTEGKATTLDGSDSKAFGEIIGWGPKSTKKLTAFNVQKDGASSFWIKTVCPPDDTQVLLDGQELPITINRGIIAAKVNGLAMLKEAGNKNLVLSSQSAGEQVLVGQFNVKE